MIKPVNGHILIEPIKHEEFIVTFNDKMQEIGTVIDYADDLVTAELGTGLEYTPVVKKGDVVYFDAWLAAKYPKEGSTDEYYWLVKWDDVRAIHAKSE